MAESTQSGDEYSDPALDLADTAQLGFVCANNSKPLHITSFPTKIGGLPLWLDQSNPIPASLTKCQSCCQPMILLMQIYTAEDFPAEAYHRYLYLFVCRNGTCHKQNWRASTRVFRAQLGLENPFYSTNTETEESIYKSNITDFQAHTCAICGVKATHKCTGCKSGWYCSQTHQEADWTWGGHKETCTTTTTTTTRQHDLINSRLVEQKWMFPELDIYTRLEEIDDSTLQSSNEQQLLVPSSNISTENENTQVGVDDEFIRFQKRISYYPNQVVRYLRVDDANNPQPLLVSKHNPLPTLVPCCERCGSVRTLECQVLSTVLAYLPLNLNDPSCFDFGTYFIYTCLNNCTLNGTYACEIIYRQDFSNEGIKLPACF